MLEVFKSMLFGRVDLALDSPSFTNTTDGSFTHFKLPWTEQLPTRSLSHLLQTTMKNMLVCVPLEWSRSGIQDHSEHFASVKGSMLGKDLSVSLMHSDPSKIESLNLIWITPKEHTFSLPSIYISQDCLNVENSKNKSHKRTSICSVVNSLPPTFICTTQRWQLQNNVCLMSDTWSWLANWGEDHIYAKAEFDFFTNFLNSMVTFNTVEELTNITCETTM